MSKKRQSTTPGRQPRKFKPLPLHEQRKKWRALDEAKRRTEIAQQLGEMSDSDLKALSQESAQDFLHQVAREMWTVRRKAEEEAQAERFREAQRQSEQALIQQLATLSDSDLDGLIKQSISGVVRKKVKELRAARLRA